MLKLTTHAEKKQFLMNYLHEAIDGVTYRQPLMILGRGGNGKSKILEEVAEVSPVNILVIHEGEGHMFFPSSKPSDECVILLPVNGSPQEFALASALNAYGVEFLKDPAFA
jgi:hypothetical protein